jgi:flagellar assembly factor FliW
MIIETKYFGSIDCSEQDVIRFEEGVPGFETCRDFVCVEQDGTRPLIYLQSAERPDLCFLTLPILAVCPNYEVTIPPEDLGKLGLSADRRPQIGSDIACLAIVAASPGAEPTVNLLAPVVINLQQHLGLQVIQFESDYSHQHRLGANDEEPVACW